MPLNTFANRTEPERVRLLLNLIFVKALVHSETFYHAGYGLSAARQLLTFCSCLSLYTVGFS